MAKKDFLTMTMTKEEAYNRLACIPEIKQNVQKLVMLIEGNKEKHVEGLLQKQDSTNVKLDFTNSKVRKNTKMIYFVVGAGITLFVALLGAIISIAIQL